MRTSVRSFAEVMEKVLQVNDHKGGWGKRQCSLKYLRRRLFEEFGEWVQTQNPAELPDIANYCMMIYERETR